MTTHLPQPDEQPANLVDAANATGVNGSQDAPPSHQPASPSQPIVLAGPPSQSRLPDEEEDLFEQPFFFEDEPLDQGTPLAVPFQISQAMPAASAPAQSSDPASAAAPASAFSQRKTRWKLPFSLPLVAILICVVVISGLFVMTALAQTTPPLQTPKDATAQPAQQTRQTGSAGSAGKQPQPTGIPTSVPSPVPTNGAKGQGQGQEQGQGQQGQAPADWAPQQLPPGWTDAGLHMGDGIQALRTAVTFTDREMSLDYRSAGTRNHHGGTFTAATFVMTPAARQRFQRNDIRAMNHRLFDQVMKSRMIRLVINPQPRLLQFAEQRQQQFAWVDVAFHLWQSRIDPNDPKLRIEGKELDPKTNQPRIHHMMVLLLRIPQQDAGTNPAMGGTGWLVSHYGLDLPDGAALEIVQPA